MSASIVHFCDGPACLVSNDEADDQDDLIARGWLVVNFLGSNEDGDDEERYAHLHSYPCLVAWAALEEDE